MVFFTEIDMKCLSVLLALFSLVACTPGAVRHETPPIDVLKSVYYDGQSDDLLTAGLGLSGLRGAAPTSATQPTAQQLRRLSYHQQFKALNDLSEAGGYGRLHGLLATQAAVPGWEHWTQRSVADGVHHTVVLQIPDNLHEQPCLVVAPSSGSRNVFGAVGTSGAWALSQGCAVVYTDKGTGTEVALQHGQRYRIDGLISGPQDPLVSATEMQAGTTHQVVQKHAHSQVHPERYWGQFVLDAAAFAIGLLAQEQGIARNELQVMAASVSNGGGAVLRAAELDQHGWLDGVVAAEPQVNLSHRFNWRHAKQTQSVTTRPLLALSLKLALLEPCAALDPQLDQAPFKFNTAMLVPLLQQRCQMLADDGLVVGENTKQQAADSLRQIKELGVEPAAWSLAQINTLANLWAAINHTYSNSYLQRSAKDSLCQSALAAFAATGQPRALSQAEEQAMFALSNGITSPGIELAVTDETGQVKARLATEPGYGYQVQRCFVDLLDTEAMQGAIELILVEPHRNQIPTVILHGQADGTVAVNHASRAYFHQNQSHASRNPYMRYVEIEQVQHFDAFLAYPGFDQQFVPMHPYFEQAMDLMLRHLRSGHDLPPSQWIKTQTRAMAGQQVEALQRHHVPGISQQPAHPMRVSQDNLEVQ